MLSKFLPKGITVGICVMLAFALLVIPIISKDMLATAALPQDAQTACADAERQAQSDINGTTWMAIGCLTGLIGYLIAMQEPNPPATHLLGKSPEYVAAYTDCYRKKGKEIKTKNALYGCLAGTAAYVLLWVIVIAAAEEEATDTVYYY